MRHVARALGRLTAVLIMAVVMVGCILILVAAHPYVSIPVIIAVMFAGFYVQSRNEG